MVINPNTTGAMTEKIAKAAKAVANSTTEITAVNPDKGPVSIEGYYDEAYCVPGLLELVCKGEKEGYNGYIIACFDDTGLDAARAVAVDPFSASARRQCTQQRCWVPAFLSLQPYPAPFRLSNIWR
jgi:allantoin racemase